MATNFIQNGETITWTNGTGSAIASGDIVEIGALIGVALVDIAASASGAVATKGVFELPAVNNAAITQGAKVYFDAQLTTVREPAILKAIELYRTPAWAGMQRAGMSSDVSWDRSATLYADLYRSLATDV